MHASLAVSLFHVANPCIPSFSIFMQLPIYAASDLDRLGIVRRMQLYACMRGCVCLVSSLPGTESPECRLPHPRRAIYVIGRSQPRPLQHSMGNSAGRAPFCRSHIQEKTLPVASWIVPR